MGFSEVGDVGRLPSTEPFDPAKIFVEGTLIGRLPMRLLGDFFERVFLSGDAGLIESKPPLQNSRYYDWSAPGPRCDIFTSFGGEVATLNLSFIHWLMENQNPDRALNEMLLDGRRNYFLVLDAKGHSQLVYVMVNNCIWDFGAMSWPSVPGEEGFRFFVKRR